MAESSIATPTSSTGKLPAQKDKQCPFCHQAFTSSSLGRHLDLYIKEKNPKPPDDVHNVEEIRRMRSAITRRQAKSSHSKQDDSATSSTKGTPRHEQNSPQTSRGYTNVLNPEEGAIKTYWNQLNWQATGVINDLPPIPKDDQLSAARRRTPSRMGFIKEDLTRRQRNVEERDRGQAAELALKEVLESVRSANSRAHPPTPFDFNFFSLSLPQIYLKCLSPPPELLSETPSLSQATWSVDPPGLSDCEIARSWLQDRLHDWRRRRENLRFGNDVVQNGVTGSTAIYVEDEAINNEEGLYNDHLTKVHRRWTELPDTDRQQQWHYECAKAFAREREQHLLTIRKLEQTEQENMLLRKHLTAQGHNASSSEIQDSPLYHQHSLIPTSDKSASYLPKSPSWDFDVLIGKWKSRIQSARSTQYPLPSSTTGEWGSSGPPAGSTSGQTARFEGAGGGGDSGRFTGLQRAAQDAQSGLRGLRDFARGGAQDQDEDVDDAPAEEEEEDDDDRPGATSRQSPVRDTADDESSRGRERAGHPAAVTAARGSDGGPMDTEE